MRNLFILSFLTLQTFSSGLYAGTDYWYGDRNCDTAPCAPCVEDCCGGEFCIGADWLYWNCDEDKLEFAAHVITTPGVDGTAVTSKVIRPRFKEQSGYRVYGEYTVPLKDWKLAVAFTHIPNRASTSFEVDPATLQTNFISLISTNMPLLTAFEGVSFSSVSSRVSGKIEYLDVDVTKIVCITDAFKICPHIGIRGLWGNQKLTIDAISPTLSVSDSMTQKTCGVGVEGGLWGDVKLIKGFSLVGHIGGSLIYTKFHTRGSVDGVPAAEDAIAISFNDSVHGSMAMFDTFIGIRYEANLADLDVSAHVGWEQHTMFDMNHFSLTSYGNISLQGLTLGGGITF